MVPLPQPRFRDAGAVVAAGRGRPPFGALAPADKPARLERELRALRAGMRGGSVPPATTTKRSPMAWPYWAGPGAG